MSGFLYFHPNASQPVNTLARARELGLGYAFTAAPSSCQCIGPETPGGTNGMVFADGARMGEWAIRVVMAEQQWRKIPKSDCFVGYWTAEPPTPEGLARPVQLPGYFVTMGDHEWVIPLTARFDETRRQVVTALPCYLECDDDGNWKEGDVLSVHEHLWKIGEVFRDDIMRRMIEDAAPIEFTRQQLLDAAVGYLQANYVVGSGELSLMRALTTEPAIHGAILAANDYPTFLRWSEEQKKSAQVGIADGSTTASGEAA